MSSLRLKHDLHPIVRQLESCDYVVSARMAVERKLLSGKCFVPLLDISQYVMILNKITYLSLDSL